MIISNFIQKYINNFAWVLTIPIHGKADIGSWLFQEILKQIGITEEEFNRLR